MPRKHPVPEKEQAICRRIREFREREGRSRLAFARQTRVNAAVLAAYEFARAPIRYSLIRKIRYSGFQINPVWLMTGQGEMHWDKRIDQDLEQRIPDVMLFSEAFETYLRPEIEKHTAVYNEQEMGYPPLFEPPVGMPSERIPGYYLLNSLPFALRFLERDPELARRFADEVHKVAKKFLALQSRQSKKKPS